MTTPVPSPTRTGPSEAEVVDLLITRALWSRDDAATIRAVLPGWAYGGHVLRPALAALIADHDLNQPDAPAGGLERMTALWAWVQARAGDVQAARDAVENWQYARRQGSTQPEPIDPYRDAATSMHAVRDGLPDPALLRHARSVLTILPALAAPDAHTDATTSQLLTQLTTLRAAALAAALD
jgi:hypothetical protein